MKLGAVIIENRFDVSKVIEEHKKFLPGWEVIHFDYMNIRTMRDYNMTLTSKRFWELLPFDKVLIFQHDSGLLRTGIEEFLSYDYVGAPFKFQEHGGNGGLSIRSKEAMIRCIEKKPWKGINEDVYFSNIMHDHPNEFKLAPREVCRKFSVETIYEIGTLGYHNIEAHLSKEQVLKIKTQYL